LSRFDRDRPCTERIVAAETAGSAGARQVAVHLVQLLLDLVGIGVLDADVFRIVLARGHVHFLYHLLDDLAQVLAAEYDHRPRLVQRLDQNAR